MSLYSKLLFLSDGSIGMLRVLEEYQRRGLGKLLIKTIVGKAIELGLMPFVHIEEIGRAHV